MLSLLRDMMLNPVSLGWIVARYGDIEGGEVRANVHLGRRSAKLASRKRARMSRVGAPPAARDAGKSSRESPPRRSRDDL